MGYKPIENSFVRGRATSVARLLVMEKAIALKVVESPRGVICKI